MLLSLLRWAFSYSLVFFAGRPLPPPLLFPPAQRRGGILIGRELCPVISQVAAAHSTKCIKEDGRDSLHQLYYGTGPATMPSGMLPRSPASRRGRSQEGSCCPERTPRLLTSTAGEATKNGYKGYKERRQDENGDKTRTTTRRLVLRRELLKDAIYMATKAVDKYSRRGYKEVRERRQDENGDKKAHAAQRAAQGRHLHGYQGCRQVQQERLQRSSRTATRRLVLRRELLKDAKRAGHH